MSNGSRCHREHPAADRRRRLPGTPRRRRNAWSSRRASSPTATTSERRAAVSRAGGDASGSTAPLARARQRSLARRFSVAAARTLRIHRARLGGPCAHLAARLQETSRRKPGNRDRLPRRRRTRASHRRARRASRRAPPHRVGAGDQRSEPQPRGARGTRRERGPAQARAALPGSAARGARTRRRSIVEVERERARFSSVVRVLPALRRAEARRARHLRGLRGAPRRTSPPWASTCVYLPPIHPIGTTERKGPNNAPRAGADDVGSPWAIGAQTGGHKAVHPQLGTLEDFRRLVAQGRTSSASRSRSTSPFSAAPIIPTCASIRSGSCTGPTARSSTPRIRRRNTRTSIPSTSKREAWRELWAELKSVVDFWIEQGVRIFRVDNPHTKPFAFWEWLIAEVRRAHPDVIFLAEAFTRPEADVPAGQARLHPVVQLFHLAQHARTSSREYFTELDSAPVARFLPAESLAEHARHPAPSICSSAAGRLHGAPGARGDARRELRHLRPGVRAHGAPAARARQRGISRLREVPAAPLGSRARPTACASSSRA